MKKYNTVLSIAGSDSGGGAGIQADIKAISACHCYAATAITAVTVQNTIGVSDVAAVPVLTIEGQIKAVLDDIGADAVKIGMLHSSEVVKCVATQLGHYLSTGQAHNVVLDPVMVSTSGHRLIEQSAISALLSDLIPLARVITPNIPEAEILLDEHIKLSTNAQLREAVRTLAQRTGTSVLLKAGHLLDEDTLVDFLWDNEQKQIVELPARRIDTPNTHGTGCTLSSAFAAYLAQGLTLAEAATCAKRYLNDALVAGAAYRIGHGHGPVHHFYNLK